MKSERKYRRVKTKVDPVSMTKQSFKDECDINKIMAKFQKTGAIEHYAKHQPQYGDTTGIDYLDCLNVVANANTMFEELPSTIRKKFENDPRQFLDFVQNPDNQEEMIELGLKPDSRADIRNTTSQRKGDQPEPAQQEASPES